MEPVRHAAGSYLCWNASRRPQAPAVVDADRVLSFAELAGAVAQVAAVLRASLGEGAVVGVRLANVWEYVALDVAVAHAGAILMPLTMVLGGFELESALARSGATMLVHAEGDSTAVEAARRVNGVRGALAADLFARSTAELPAVSQRPADPDRVIEIALTSGTTGMPKLASHTERSKQATFEGFTSRLGVTEDDRVLAMSPLTQGIGGCSLFALRRGATMVMRRDLKFTPERTLELIERARVTVLVGVPTNVIRMLASPRLGSARMESLRVTALAGSPLPETVARDWERATGSRVCNFYGSMDAGQLSVVSPEDADEKRFKTVGRPHSGLEVMICDPEGSAMPPGSVGEICMRGPTVQPRYWGEDLSPMGPDGWVHMGDLGLVDADGYVHVVGRVKDTIIRGGTNINPHEVEEVLRGHPDVADACVVGASDPDLGERPVAFVVTRPGRNVGLNDVRGYLEVRGLARYKWPESVEIVDEIPLSGPGKVNRRALRERLASTHEPAPERLSAPG